MRPHKDLTVMVITKALFVVLFLVIVFFFLTTLVPRCAQPEKPDSASLFEIEEIPLDEIINSFVPSSREFAREAITYSLEIQEAYGIPASATIGMAIYESRYGKSATVKRARNYFGIKSTRRDEPRKWFVTKEFDRSVTRRQPFRAYSSMHESFYDYAKFLSTQKRYSSAFKTPLSGPAFVSKVAECGYCPDSDYSSSVARIIRRHNLQRLDKKYTVIVQNNLCSSN